MPADTLKVCTNRKYMGLKYLSPKQLCDNCEYEVHDLFSGTSGIQVWAWYCRRDDKHGC